MPTQPSPLDMLEQPGAIVAVVGATDAPGKFGGAVYRNLKQKGFAVCAVNPHRDTVDGDRAYPDLAALPVKPDLVSLVVPPAVTLEVLKQCLELGLTSVWLQPGAEDEAVLAFLEAEGFAYLAGVCIMVESHPRR
jgi:predicted CoA-binding protein